MKINKKCEELSRTVEVMIQVDTSGETSKSGVSLEATVDLAEFIAGTCLHLRLTGLMTIGAVGDIH